MRHWVRFGAVALVAAFLTESAMAWSGAGGYEGAMGGHYGKTTPGYLGVDIRDVSEEQVATLKLKDARGAEITVVDHDGPACKAGLLIHDVIVQMNGQAVENKDELKKMLREMLPGQTVSFVISRDGRQQTISTQMVNRETLGKEAWEQHYTVPEPGSEAGSGIRGNGFFKSSASSSVATQGPKGHRDFLGVTMILSASFTGAQLEVMGPQLAEFFGAQGGAGLMVRRVDTNSPAAAAGMHAGDVVVKVNSVAVTSGNDWSKTVHENKGRPVTVVVLRDKKEQTLTLTPDGKKRSSVEWRMGFPVGLGGERKDGLVAEL